MLALNVASHRQYFLASLIFVRTCDVTGLSIIMELLGVLMKYLQP